MKLPLHRSARGLLCLAAWLLAASAAQAQAPIVIRIVGSGNAARFEGVGSTDEPIITPGQPVTWRNEGDIVHTARSMDLGPDNARVFDTRFITVGQSQTVVFDAAKFQAANVPPGSEKRIEYQCEVHQGMRGFLRLRAAGDHLPDQHPPVSPSAPLLVFEAVSEGPNQLFKPGQQSALAAGSEIVWRNAASNPGLHALTFSNWNRDKEFLEVLSSDVGFDQATGRSSENSAQGGAAFLRARLKKLPLDSGATIDFYCTVHGSAMSGKITFRAQEQIATVPMPVYQVAAAPFAAFDAVRIGEKKADSYFALSVDINGDGLKDLVTSGLGQPGISLAEVDWYENPTWKRHVIGRFDVPVALDAADVDGDGNVDLAICYDYGTCIFGCKPENGTVAWLRNPGVLLGDPEWERHPIGKLMATHRLRFGHFSRTDQLELLAVPVVGGVGGNIHEPIRTTIFTRPEHPLAATEWTSTVINDQLRVIHEISTGRYDRSTMLDSALTASEEGVTWLHTTPGGPWRATRIGTGEESQVNFSTNHWKGSGAVDVGAFGADPLAFIAATEPFHGNIFALYTKSHVGTLDQLTWKRRVVDVYGALSNRGEGPGHDVVMADIDGDGNDEILVGLRDPTPYCGVQLYKVVDLEKGVFLRQQVSSTSAAQVVVDDFDNDGRPDFATIPYRVLTYSESPDTAVMLYLNRTPQKKNAGARGTAKHE